MQATSGDCPPSCPQPPCPGTVPGHVTYVHRLRAGSATEAGAAAARRPELRRMPRLPRYALDGQFHHITARATGGALLYVDDEDRRWFRDQLRSALRAFQLTCHAWCLMGTHYHVILEGPLTRLSPTMHRLDGRYATWFNERHGRRGRLFADRFASFVIRD